MAPNPLSYLLFVLLISYGRGDDDSPGRKSFSQDNSLELRGQKDRKSFSLFTIVNFPNIQCETSTSPIMYGTCYSSSECSDKGGAASGNCASGFGVCCMFTLTACGGTVSQNCTYIQNPSYPSSYAITASTTCTYSVSYVESNICQLRIDFDTFQIADPGAATGMCSTDTFTATGPTGVNPPTICGTNTDLHMYVETGKSSTQTTLAFVMDGATTATRQYKVKVSQIPCDVIWKAPQDCTQYFTGMGGTTTTYNFGHMIANQAYSTCVRQEVGVCHIQWSSTSITTPDPFALSDLPAIAIKSDAPTNCAISYVQIPTTAVAPPVFCGGNLNTGGNTIEAEADGNPGIIPSSKTPFTIQTVATDANQAAAITGYSLQYSQIPCGASAA